MLTTFLAVYVLSSGCSNGVSTHSSSDGADPVSLVLGEVIPNDQPLAVDPPTDITPFDSGPTGSESPPATSGGDNPTDNGDTTPTNPVVPVAPDLLSFPSRTSGPAFFGLGLPANGENSLSAGLSADGFHVAVDAHLGLQFALAGFGWDDLSGYTDYLYVLSNAPFNSARALSSTGKFAVGKGLGSRGYVAVRWDDELGPVQLGQLSATVPYSEATAISQDGLTVAGIAASGDGFVAFRWTAEAGLQSLGDFAGGGLHSAATGVSADGSVLVGVGETDNGELAFRWTAVQGMFSLGTLAGGTTSRANAISADGAVVVGTASSSAGQQAFRWTATDGMVGLGDLPGGEIYSAANAVSGDGSVIVGVSNSSAGFEAFLWTPGNGMQRLADVLAGYGLNATGWQLNSATAISADGKTIVGHGVDPQGVQQAWLAHLP